MINQIQANINIITKHDNVKKNIQSYLFLAILTFP